MRFGIILLLKNYSNLKSLRENKSESRLDLFEWDFRNKVFLQ